MLFVPDQDEREGTETTDQKLKYFHLPREDDRTNNSSRTSLETDAATLHLRPHQREKEDNLFLPLPLSATERICVHLSRNVHFQEFDLSSLSAHLCW